MVSNITSRMLNLLGLLSAGVLLTQSNLVNAQSATSNANSSSTAKPVPAKPSLTQPLPTTPPAVKPPASMPVAADALKTAPVGVPVPEETKPNPTIVDLAAGNESFKTLTAAVKAAGLTTALASEGPFTVFAPTDKAFAALPAGVVEQLLQPENKPLLTKILSYHVVSGKLLAADLKSGELISLQGSPIAVQIKTATAKAVEPTTPMPKPTGNAAIPQAPVASSVTKPSVTAPSVTAPSMAKPSTTVLINQAQVQLADVTASNGVIHAIDQVILPPDLMQKLRQSSQAPTAEPKATEPKATEPKVTEPKATAPKATAPKATAPKPKADAPKL
jgi:uncharacterized surface protein with fasciclin (FAS1) repeats